LFCLRMISKIAQNVTQLIINHTHVYIPSLPPPPVVAGRGPMEKGFALCTRAVFRVFSPRTCKEPSLPKHEKQRKKQPNQQRLSEIENPYSFPSARSSWQDTGYTGDSSYPSIKIPRPIVYSLPFYIRFV